MWRGIKGDSFLGKSGGRGGGEVLDRKGLRQECPLSPSLFTLLIADMDEELKKAGWGGG